MTVERAHDWHDFLNANRYGDLMSVGERARSLNLSTRYVRKRLLHVLGRVHVVRGCTNALHSRAEASSHKHQQTTRRAPRALARVSQDAGLYQAEQG
ncbi:hypothetical protein [Paraburkholderia atlantica]|uniref:hypothetical protein n=1 Tax=Paraburkholderia atlantica TaxID=2654982 RepID=UPI00035FEFD2|nr:hypothetical protein [Paraburkholderia atlantica]